MRVAAVAPSHAYDPARLEAGLDVARGLGVDVHLVPDTLRPHRYFAAPDDHRLAQLVAALTDPGWDAVWMVRGGSGLTRLLPRIPWADLSPRPVIGFSDVVALHAGLWRHGLGPLVHGPVLHSLPTTDAASVRHLSALLHGEPLEPLSGETWAAGAAQGPLLGGNLCVLAALCGTPWQLSAAGAILVLEEIGEAPYRVDRSLQQLASAGVLDGVAGVALGTFTGCAPPEGAPWTLRDLVLEHLAPLGVPVLADLPIGHGVENRAFVWGRTARIDGGHLSLTSGGVLSGPAGPLHDEQAGGRLR